MATECSTQLGFGFQPKLALDFEGGQLTTDAGLLLLRELDHRLGLTASLDSILEDGRDPRYVTHSTGALLRQRIYQIAAGYEDAVDANLLRFDPAFQTMVNPGGPGDPLAAQPTLSRLENSASWSDVYGLTDLSLQWFLRQGARLHRSPRQEILLDADSTDDPTHGHQQLALFHGKYGTYMYHPLLIFEGHTGHLLRSRLRRGTASAHEGTVVELERMLPRLREAFPEAPIGFRADAGFASPKLINFLEEQGISYLVGIPHHQWFRPLTASLRRRAQARYDRTGDPVRMFSSFHYRARSWPRQRRILVKVEVSAQGCNIRCVITNRHGRAAALFALYNRRGEVENRIDELKNDLRMDRLSCSRYRANAFRLQLHALAYNLLHLFRHWMAPTELARAETSTLRLKLFKVAARVQRTARRIWFHLASSWPYRSLFHQAARAIQQRAPALT